NPIAVLLNKAVLEFIPHDTDGLKENIERWAEWVKNRVSEEIASLYPRDHDGGVPLVYLWARTVICEGPNCGFSLPLIRTLDLGNGQTLVLIPKKEIKAFELAVQKSGAANFQQPTVKGGSVTCPACGYTTPAKSVKAQLTAKRGGSTDAQLL